MSQRPTVTTLLAAAGRGDRAAEAELFRLVYDELKRIARSQLRRAGGGLSLNPSALVHEAWLKLSQGSAPSLGSSQHFYSLVARAMRQILLDLVKQKGRIKHGGEHRRTDLSDGEPGTPVALDELLSIERARTELEGQDPELAKLVEWHFFVGLKFGEIAELAGESERSVRRRWQLARAFLLEAMRGAGG
jgi:RNA polymerase sigma factor (TIGR02999 family)